jgi:hypothetical protein
VNVVLFFHMVSGEATGLLTVISKEALPVVWESPSLTLISTLVSMFCDPFQVLLFGLNSLK